MFISKLALSPPRLIGVLVVAVMLTACTDNQPTAPPPTQVMRMVGRSSLTLPTLNVPTTTFAMPDINVTDTDEDMCADVPGLCGNTVCPAGDITGPSSDRKGTGFSLKGCGNITELTFKTISAKMSGDFVFGTSINPAQIGLDPGCIEKTITVPGRPGIPATPPIRGPLGNIIWPGTPAVPAKPATSYTVRVPLNCDPLRPPSLNVPASFLGFQAYAHPSVDVEVEVEAAGSGEVELRIPIPKAAKSFTTVVGQNNQHLVSAGVGVYLVFRGRLTNTPVRFVAKVIDEFSANFNFNAASGWDGDYSQGPFSLTGSVNAQSPDTAAFQYGIQPAVSFALEPFPAPVPGILDQSPGYQIEAGAWADRFFVNTFTGQSTGNLENAATAGLDGRVYASYTPVDPGQDGPCALDAILSCINDVVGGIGAKTFDKPFSCCEANLYEEYGTGQFRFSAVTTGAAGDIDPDGYRLMWQRTSTTPYPYVDSVMMTTIPSNGKAAYPDVDAAVSNLPSDPFGLYTRSSCTEFHSDLVLQLSPIAGAVLPELRRQGVGVPAYSKIVGCTALPADYTLTVSGLAANCRVVDQNPRVITLRPILNLNNLGAAVSPITWSKVSDPTAVTINVACSTHQAPPVSAPALPMIGLVTNDDAGAQFDFLVELFRNGAPMVHGVLRAARAGGAGFDHALIRTVNMLFDPLTALAPGDEIDVRVSVRIAEGVDGNQSGTARLWYGDGMPHGGIRILDNGTVRLFHLGNDFVLSETQGDGPMVYSDVLVDRTVDGSAFKPFGTWKFVY